MSGNYSYLKLIQDVVFDLVFLFDINVLLYFHNLVIVKSFIFQSDMHAELNKRQILALFQTVFFQVL